MSGVIVNERARGCTRLGAVRGRGLCPGGACPRAGAVRGAWLCAGGGRAGPRGSGAHVSPEAAGGLRSAGAGFSGFSGFLGPPLAGGTGEWLRWTARMAGSLSSGAIGR